MHFISKTDSDGIPVDLLPKTGISEINVLSRSMNNMIESNTKSRKELKVFQTAVETSTDAIGMATPEAVHWYQNHAFSKMFGIIKDKSPSTVYCDQSVGRHVFQTIMAGKPWSGGVKMYGKDNQILNILLRAYAVRDKNAAIVALVGVHTDITELRRSQEVMIQSDKMLSVGGLAAGMAHEINNPLAGMMQTADTMARRLNGKNDIPANFESAKRAGVSMDSIKNYMESRGILSMVNTIIESGIRVANIVNNMLSFSRKSEGRFAYHNMPELFDKALELATTDYNLKMQYDFKQIVIDKKYEEDLPRVYCEGGKIQQVFLNILRNSAHAMQTAGIEKPTVSARIFLYKKNDKICIELEDNGPGINESTRKRIFEPFFTTKPVGEGTGLGLSVSYFIITENHRGDMRVESQPGAGTKFIIRLPLVGRDV